MTSIWAIGDLQGCCQALDRLLEHPDIASDTNARFWFAGDLVNRGPTSLATLRRVIALGDRAVTVLGNHDLHLLGVAAGVRKAGKSDTIADILAASDADALLDWVRAQPLAHYEAGHLLVHAGVLPGWSAADTLARAAEVQTVLRGPNWRDFLTEMYGNSPHSWNDSLTGPDRLRVIVNMLTRMRFCSPQGRMDFDAKEGAAGSPQGYLPWFDAPRRGAPDDTIVFGHWSALGLVERPRLLGLDTGCVWGGQLTAIRLYDRKRVQISCAQLPGTRKPG